MIDSDTAAWTHSAFVLTEQQAHICLYIGSDEFVFVFEFIHLRAVFVYRPPVDGGNIYSGCVHLLRETVIQAKKTCTGLFGTLQPSSIV